MEIVGLLLIGLLIVMSPGADFILVLKNTMAGGRRAGLLTAIGISLAIVVHVTYCFIGVSYIVSQNIYLYSAVKYLGSAYLIYLGIKSILTADQQLVVSADLISQPKKTNYFVQGFLCNTLNPKTMLFFVSLFSQLVPVDGGSYVPGLVYGSYISVLHWLWFSLAAILFSSTVFMTYMQSMKKRLDQICGGMLILFGSALALKA